MSNCNCPRCQVLPTKHRLADELHAVQARVDRAVLTLIAGAMSATSAREAKRILMDAYEYSDAPVCVDAAASPFRVPEGGPGSGGIRRQGYDVEG